MSQLPPATATPRSEPLVGANPVAAVRRFFMRAFQLRGRASASEYWWWTLIQTTVTTVVSWLVDPGSGAFDVVLGPAGPWGTFELAAFSYGPGVPVDTHPVVTVLAVLWPIVTAIPAFTLAVRRLHDSNCSGTWLFLLLLGPLGSTILLCMMCRTPRIEGTRFD